MIVFLNRIRALLGVMLRDSRRYRAALSEPESGPQGTPLWQKLCNRNESLEINPNGPGVRCEWRWTSDLHACNVRPILGQRLAQLAFSKFPVRFRDTPEVPGQPQVSFIIAHQGKERIDHILWTVRSILAQQQVAIECLVIDQSTVPYLGDQLPTGVRYFHRPLPQRLTGWRKSWAFNQGARAATGEILVFHDGDIICPVDYAMHLVRDTEQYGAASIQRFLFNLTQSQTEAIFRTGTWPEQIIPQRVRQNWEGGTIAVRRKAFIDLGGYDEAFVGWGGEDNEFFDRCREVGHLRYGFVPFIHLWHPPQPDKHSFNNPNVTDALERRLKISAADRIRELKQRDFGNTHSPTPEQGYRDATPC